MKYQYEYELDDFSDLAHVRWIAEHIEDFEFHGNTDSIRRDILDGIVKKNVFYSSCVNAYQEFCNAFDNNPYNYMTEVLDVPEDHISCLRTDHYLIRWKEKEKEFVVPLAYLTETGRKPDSQSLEDFVKKGRLACTDFFEQLREKSDEALGEIGEYLGGIEAVYPLRKKDAKGDILTVIFTWMALLMVLYLHPWGQQLLRQPGLKGTSGTDRKWLYMGIVLCGMCIRMIQLTVRFARKQMVLRNMRQILEYGQRIKQLKNVAEEAEEVLYRPVEGILQKQGHIRELRDLEELSKRRLKFEHPSALQPEQYCTYACTLRKSVMWILLLCILSAGMIYMIR